jgi:PAS domain-containing protein
MPFIEMKAYDIEIILSRQLAETLSIPIFITDPEGTLLFYNESAEEILGKRFEETGEMKVDVWATIFKPFDENGKRLNPDDLPLVQTLKNRIPAHGSFWIESLKGEKFKLYVTSYPLLGRGSRYLGAVAIFWTKS